MGYLASSFQDKKGREWTVRFNGKSMKQAQEELNVNICDAFVNPQEFLEAMTPAVIIALVWITIRDDAKKRDVSLDEFLESMWGESLLSMNDATWSALVNFSQPEKNLGTAQKLLDQTRRVLDRRQETATKYIEDLTDEKLEKLLGLPSIESSLKQLDTAESTPTPEPTANSIG